MGFRYSVIYLFIHPLFGESRYQIKFLFPYVQQLLFCVFMYHNQHKFKYYIYGKLWYQLQAILQNAQVPNPSIYSLESWISGINASIINDKNHWNCSILLTNMHNYIGNIHKAWIMKLVHFKVKDVNRC